MHPHTHDRIPARQALRAQIRAGLHATGPTGCAALAWRVAGPGLACLWLWSLLGYGWIFFATAASVAFVQIAVFVHTLPVKGDLALREQAIREAQHLLLRLAQALGQHHKARQTILWMDHGSEGPRCLRAIVGPSGIQTFAVPGWLMAALEDIAARHHQQLRPRPPLAPHPPLPSMLYPFVEEVGNVNAGFFGTGVNVGSAHARLAAVQALMDALPPSAQALYTGLDLEPISA